jgi:hypothetical protein
MQALQKPPFDFTDVPALPLASRIKSNFVFVCDTMNLKLIYILYLFCCSQAFGQNILVLEVPGTIKNYKFYENDKIEFLLRSYDQVMKGRIVRLSKNMLVLDSYSMDFAIDSITTIYTTRGGLRFFGELFLKAGLGYFVVGSVNLLINEDHAGLIKNRCL